MRSLGFNSSLGLVVGCLLGCDAAGVEPMRAVMPDMAFSIPYNAYDPHPVIGPVLRHPPEGTIPHGGSAQPYGPGPEEAARAGRELTSPFAGRNDKLPEAKRLYDTFCVVCHGSAGEGDGPIIGRFPNPPSLLSPRAKELPDGHLFHVVTFGQGLMAPYASQLDPTERWMVIRYVRWLQETVGGAQ